MYQKIAEWLYNRIVEDEVLYQSQAVEEIEDEFGEKYVYENENGNLAIHKKILEAFRVLNKGEIIWQRKDYRWAYIENDHEAEELIKKL